MKNDRFSCIYTEDRHEELRYDGGRVHQRCGKGNGHPRSYHSSTRDNMRIRRRDFIIIGSATTIRMQGVTSVKIR